MKATNNNTLQIVFSKALSVFGLDFCLEHTHSQPLSLPSVSHRKNRKVIDCGKLQLTLERIPRSSSLSLIPSITSPRYLTLPLKPLRREITLQYDPQFAGEGFSMRKHQGFRKASCGRFGLISERHPQITC